MTLSTSWTVGTLASERGAREASMMTLSTAPRAPLTFMLVRELPPSPKRVMVYPDLPNRLRVVLEPGEAKDVYLDFLGVVRVEILQTVPDGEEEGRNEVDAAPMDAVVVAEGGDLRSDLRLYCNRGNRVAASNIRVFVLRSWPLTLTVWSHEVRFE